MCGSSCCQHSTPVLKSNRIAMFCSGRPHLMCEHMREGEMRSGIKGDTCVCLNLLYHNFPGNSDTAIQSSHDVYERCLSFFFLLPGWGHKFWPPSTTHPKLFSEYAPYKHCVTKKIIWISVKVHSRPCKYSLTKGPLTRVFVHTCASEQLPGNQRRLQ